MFSGSVYAGFVLALSFHHGDLEPDCVKVSTRGGLMRGIKIPPQDFPLKMQGGAYARGGAYLRDTTVVCSTSTGLQEDLLYFKTSLPNLQQVFQL